MFRCLLQLKLPSMLYCFSLSIFIVMSIVSNDHLQALSIVLLRCLTGINCWFTVQNPRGEQIGLSLVIEGKTLFSLKSR